MSPKDHLPQPDNLTLKAIDQCSDDILALVLNARRRVASLVDRTMVETYWQAGKRIVQVEQGGEKRAAYGEFIIQRISQQLNHRLGSGFSPSVLKRMRKFYLVYEKGARGGHLLSQDAGDSEKGAHDGHLLPAWPLVWSHYRVLITLDNPRFCS